MLTMVKVVIMVFVLSLSSIATVCSWGAEVVKPAKFYKDKQVNYMIGSSAGDSMDFIARTMASHVQKRLGATLVIENKGGAGTVQAANEVWMAKPDGLSLGTWEITTVFLDEALDTQGRLYKLDPGFSYIIGYPSEPNVLCVSTGGPYNTIADLKAAKKLKIGGLSAKGNVGQASMSFIYTLDLDAKCILGYKGFAPITLAIAQKELDGGAYPISTARIFIARGQVKPLVVLDTKRYKALPDVPAITEVAKLTPEQLEIVKIWGSELLLTKFAFTTPGVPKDRVAFLREVYTASAADCRKELEDLYGFKDMVFLTGQELEAKAETIVKKRTRFQELFGALLERYKL